jgi:N-acetylmuramoyl-L-alanine amidase
VRLVRAAMVTVALVAAACSDGSPGASAPTASPKGSASAPPVVLVTPAVTPSPEASTPTVPKPPIVWKPIPFPASRADQMAAYAERHYGIRTSRLTDPQVIVEHFTDGTSFSSAWNTFASNASDLGELPGKCSHFVIDTDGTIYQLVPLDVMCRHAVGLNWTAFSIEMVAQSDQQVLHDPPQYRAALQLTGWLMARFGIHLGNVIGHNESLTSPFHHELDPSWRCQTHADWNHADMEVFRSDLAALARSDGVPLGPPTHPVDSGCG